MNRDLPNENHREASLPQDENQETEKKSWRHCHCVARLVGVLLLLLSVPVVAGVFARWPAEDYSSPDLEPSLRALRGGLLVCMWVFGHTINTVVWRRARLHNVLVFESIPPFFMNSKQLFVAALAISVIWMAGLYLVALAPWLHISVCVGPLVMYGVLVSVLVLPFPVLKRRSRIWLLKKLGRIVCAPFFYVTFADFWVADQLISLTVVLMDTEYFFCYLIFGQITKLEGAVLSCGRMTYGVRMIVQVLPAWWRTAQCMRRYYDTWKAKPHLLNTGKYASFFLVSMMFAASDATKDPTQPFSEQSVLHQTLVWLWVLAGIFFASYTLFWETFIDWNLLPNIPRHCCTKNALTLRKERMYNKKFYYIVALVENTFSHIARTVFLAAAIIAGSNNEDVYNILYTVAVMLEVFRRIVWNFFRLENEHASNVGQFLVPVPSVGEGGTNSTSPPEITVEHTPNTESMSRQ